MQRSGKMKKENTVTNNECNLKNRIKQYFKAILTVKNYLKAIFNLTFVLLLISPSITKASNSNPLNEGRIRPYFIAGDNGHATDFLIDIIIPIKSSENSLIFFNPNLRYGEDSSNEQNIGFGARVLKNNSFILGSNLYYDRVNTEHSNNFDQWGFGLEFLTKKVDLRANYYKPFGDKTGEIKNGKSYEFASSSILEFTTIEEALEGLDAEIGLVVPKISNRMETKVFAGIYDYNSHVGNKDVRGQRYRVELRPSNLFYINLESKHDDVRGTDNFGGLVFEAPFDVTKLLSLKNPFSSFKKSLGVPTRPLHERMTDKVVRDRHIIAPENILKDPSEVQDLIYVNGDNSNIGSGTLEDPYQSLALVEGDQRFSDGIVVYVFSTDNLADTHYANIEMPDNSVLWGQGEQWLGLGGDGPKPIIDGLEETVITLGENNMIMGLKIQNGYNGIYGENINKTLLHYNDIENNLSNGIELIHSDFASTDIVDRTVFYIFENNTINSNDGDGIKILSEIYTDKDLTGSSFTYKFTGNDISLNATAVNITNNLTAAKISSTAINNIFKENTLTDNLDSGVRLIQSVSANGNVTASITGLKINNTYNNNIIERNGSMGINLYNDVSASVQPATNITGDILSSLNRVDIVNRFSGNVIWGNGFTGINNENSLSTNLSSSSKNITGSASSSMTASYIVNIYDNNELVANRGGVYGSNNISSFGFLSSTTVGGDASLITDDVKIKNTASNNIIQETIGHGFTIRNFENKSLFLYYGSAGNVSTASSSISFENSLTGNSMTDNLRTGLDIQNSIGSERLVLDDFTFANEDRSKTFITVSDSLKNNAIANNIGLTKLTYRLYNDSVVATLKMEDNVITENGYSNLRLLKTGDGVFVGDLGGGLLGSLGGNTLIKTGGEYLSNQTGTELSLENNILGN